MGMFSGGVIQHHCPPGDLDHAVQIVGFNFEGLFRLSLSVMIYDSGLTGPVPYYIVRNTWGTDWGLDGYLYIKFGSNMCGMLNSLIKLCML
jgi:cathepsin O